MFYLVILMVYNKKLPATLRNAVWNKYIGNNPKIGMCFCCGFEQISFANFDCGHIVSRKFGAIYSNFL